MEIWRNEKGKEIEIENGEGEAEGKKSFIGEKQREGADWYFILIKWIASGFPLYT